MATRAALKGLRVLLDFLLAAGLLRLGQTGTWTPLLLAALTLVVRQVATRGLGAGRTARDRSGGSATSPTAAVSGRP